MWVSRTTRERKERVTPARQSLKAYKRVIFDSRDFLNVELENLFARRNNRIRNSVYFTVYHRKKLLKEGVFIC